MEKNPQTVAELAKNLEEENWRFLRFLKICSSLSHARVDSLADRLGRQAASQMDCRECAACCRVSTIPVDGEDVQRLSDRLSIHASVFTERFVSTNEFGQEAIDTAPCPFLDGNLCGVYEARPEACRGYPYIGGNVASRMADIIERASLCPVVFEMLEQLKTHLSFHRYG